jgi:hypothetical protein
LAGCDDDGALAAITFDFVVAAFIAWPCLEKTHASITASGHRPRFPISVFLVAAPPRYAEA